MTILIPHIEYLLTKHECVCIPGLGGFMSAYKEAEFKFTDVILPPSQSVRFNESLNYNDGLIVNSIMRDKNISFEEASVILNSEVRIIRSLLNNSENVELGTIGCLTKNSNNNLEFTASSKKSCFNLYLYGFNEIHMKRLLKPEISQDSNDENINIKPNRFNKTTYRNIASFAILLIIFLSVSLPINKNNIYQNKASLVSTNIFSDLITPDFNYYKTDITDFFITENVEQEEYISSDEINIVELNNVDENSELIIEPEIPIKRYYIIVGSFPDRDKALEYISRLESKGLSNVSILEKGDKFRLYIKCFEDKNQATEYLDESRETSCMNDAWLLAHKS